jgi:cytochrome c peroxidase
MSCLACHNPRNGLGDGLPLSRTENGRGILQRNSPHLFNVGLASREFMFWDGRVHYDKENKIFTTPEPDLNGMNPKAVEISNAMTSALAAQAIFPMVSSIEMMGLKGENEIADSKNNIEAWDKIIQRLKKERPSDNRTTSYSELFKRAYPTVDIQKINIGHVGESLAAFQREAFQSTGSPFNNYLRGDNSALSLQQKKGFAVFIGKGKCINCHVGTELGSNKFFASVGVPTWGEAPLIVDRGRGDAVLDGRKNFFFKTVSLLNVGLTAPYMHNGAFETLRDVINHYSDINTSLYYYDIPKKRKDSMPVPVALVNDSEHLNTLFRSMQAPFLREGLKLTEVEKDDLEVFLKEALTDPKWKRQ